MPVKAPLAAPVTARWTGCHAGGNAGYGWSDFKSVFSAADVTRLGAAGVTDVIVNDAGIAGGGQVGCDYQVNSWVIGARGLWDAARINGGAPGSQFPTFPHQNTMQWFTTATARIGYAWKMETLLYLQAGGAWARVKDVVHGPNGGVSEAAVADRDGWTAGIGVERHFSERWSMFLEYDYVGFGSKTVNFVTTPPAVGVPNIVIQTQNLQTILVGVNYQFW
jgi:outer membrane immunogenic protein